MKISIIIPVYSPTDKRFIELCVKSLRENSQEQHQIILAVNPEEGDYTHIPADVIFTNPEQGQCKANNKAIAFAENGWVLICDYDTVFPKNWEKVLDKLEPDSVLSLNCMENNTRGVAPKFIFNDCGGIDNFDREKFELEAEKYSEDKITQGFCYPFLFEKKHYLTIGGFDEAYDPWGAQCDSDLHYKFKLLGLQMRRYFGVVCYHFSQVSGTYFDTEEMEYYRKGNLRYFESKWQCVRARSPQIWYSEFIIPDDTGGYSPEWAGKVSRYAIGKNSENEHWECAVCRMSNLKKREHCVLCDEKKV